MKTQNTEKCIRYRAHCNTWEVRTSINKVSYNQTFKTKELARAWYKSLKESKNSKCYLTCKQIMPLWLESLKNDPNFSPQSFIKFECETNLYLLPFFGDKPIQDVTDELVFDFCVSLKDSSKKLSDKTICNIIGELSNFFEFCALRKYIRLNPAKSQYFVENKKRLLKTKRNPQLDVSKKSRTLSELRKLIAYAYEEDFGFGIGIEFMCQTAMRLGETSALTWGDIINADIGGTDLLQCAVNKTRHYKDRKIQNKAKSGSNRDCLIPRNLFEKLQQWKIILKERGYFTAPTDIMFPNIAKNQMGFSRHIGNVSEKIGIRRTTAHCLRHSFVGLVANNGHEMHLAQKAAGHRDIETTRLYYNASDLPLLPVAKTLDALFVPR